MQNHNQTWIFIFFHLINKKQRLRYLLAIGGWAHTRPNSIIKFLHALLVRWSIVCKRSVFLQFLDKIQSSMHQIFTQNVFNSFYRSATFIHDWCHQWWKVPQNYKEILLSMVTPFLYILTSQQKSPQIGTPHVISTAQHSPRRYMNPTKHT